MIPEDSELDPDDVTVTRPDAATTVEAVPDLILGDRVTRGQALSVVGGRARLTAHQITACHKRGQHHNNVSQQQNAACQK